MEEVEQAYYDSLQKFGDVNSDNATTFNSLVQINAHMANNNTSDVKNLQAQMHQLLIAVNNRSPPPVMMPPVYPEPTAYAAMPSQQYTLAPSLILGGVLHLQKFKGIFSLL
jgi:hypothetical protein